jgi:hypothetical protein
MKLCSDVVEEASAKFCVEENHWRVRFAAFPKRAFQERQLSRSVKFEFIEESLGTWFWVIDS